MIRIIILTLLIAYTGFEATLICPKYPWLAVIFSMVLITIMIQWIFLYRSKPHLIENLWFRAVVWLGTIGMGFWATLILLSIPINIIHLIFLRSDNVLLSYLNPALLIVSTGITLFGLIEALIGPKIKSVKLPLTNLSSGLNNLKIAQISDLHISPTIGESYVKKVVKMTNATNPDFIFITGDMADAKTEKIIAPLNILGDLKAKYGVFNVMGNHEYYWDALGIIKHLQQVGITTLVNESQLVNVENEKVQVAGITDPAGVYIEGHHPNVKKALDTLEKPGFKILLSHRPGYYIEAEQFGVDLQLSGHTHAGQFFPFNLLIPLAHKYYKGLNQYKNLWIYVNQGTGYWGPANRFGIPAEITLITLRAR